MISASKDPMAATRRGTSGGAGVGRFAVGGDVGGIDVELLEPAWRDQFQKVGAFARDEQRVRLVSWQEHAIAWAGVQLGVTPLYE